MRRGARPDHTPSAPAGGRSPRGNVTASAKAVATEVVNHCKKVGDRFAILDGVQQPKKLDSSSIKDGLGVSNYAAIYFPWIEVYDPVSKKPDFVPPRQNRPNSAHMKNVTPCLPSTRPDPASNPADYNITTVLP